MRGGFLSLLCWGLLPLTASASDINDAAKSGDVAAIEALLAAGADVNETDGLASPLFYALNKAHLDVAELLVSRGADVNAQSKLGGTPLMVAVMKSQPGMVALLLSKGADPDMAPGKQAPIHAAVKQGCLECVIALVQAGADPNARTTDGFARTPLHMAKSKDDTAIADYLLANGATVPVPLPLDDAWTTADPARGKVIFGKSCDGCHGIEQGSGTKEGPSLWGIVGRDKASMPDFKYSVTLQKLEGAWTYGELSTYLYDPILTTPGVRMEVPGIVDMGDRADLIAYLGTLSEAPIPLP